MLIGEKSQFDGYSNQKYRPHDDDKTQIKPPIHTKHKTCAKYRSETDKIRRS